MFYKVYEKSGTVGFSRPGNFLLHTNKLKLAKYSDLPITFHLIYLKFILFCKSKTNCGQYVHELDIHRRNERKMAIFRQLLLIGRSDVPCDL